MLEWYRAWSSLDELMEATEALVAAAALALRGSKRLDYQGKRIDYQGKRIDYQGKRIDYQGKRIDSDPAVSSPQRDRSVRAPRGRARARQCLRRAEDVLRRLGVAAPLAEALMGHGH